MNRLLELRWRGGREPSLSAGGLRQATQPMLGLVFLGALPLWFVTALVFNLTAHHLKAETTYWDFRAFVAAGHDVLNGHSPYPPAQNAVLAHESSFVYPAPAALLMVPLALIPFSVAATLFAVVLIASVPLALRILGVRDWRCYGVVLLSAPLVNAVAVDAISPLLAVPLALSWRYRDRRWIAAAALAAAITLKLFLWPLLFWFVFTRRLRTAAATVGLTALVTLGGWAAIDFHGLLAYPRLLTMLSNLLDGKGYSVVALGRSSGLSATAARVLPWLVGVALISLIALRGRRPGQDRLTFIVAVGVAFALSPIVWLHYFILLFVPIGLAAPRLSLLWALPFALWVPRGQSIQPPIWDNLPKFEDLARTARVGQLPLIAYTLLVSAFVLVVCARLSAEGERGQPRASPRN